MNIIGIDPGIRGGIAFYRAEQMLVMPMPKDIQIPKITREIWPGAWRAYVELVHAMPGQGVTSMFTFGKGYGKILGMLETLSIPYGLVSPQKWKKKVLGQKKDKQAAIAFCAHTYPNISLLATPRSRVPHDGMAEAVCIAHYGIKDYWNLL